MPRASSNKSPKRPGIARANKPASLLELIDSLLLEPITVSRDGKPTKVPVIQLIINQLVPKAASGSARATTILLSYRRLTLGNSKTSIQIDAVESAYTAEFKKIIAGQGHG